MKWNVLYNTKHGININQLLNESIIQDKKWNRVSSKKLESFGWEKDLSNKETVISL